MKEGDGENNRGKRSADRDEMYDKMGETSGKKLKLSNDGNDQIRGAAKSSARQNPRGTKSFFKKKKSKKLVKLLGSAIIDITGYFKPIKGSPMGNETDGKNST